MALGFGRVFFGLWQGVLLKNRGVITDVAAAFRLTPILIAE